MSAVCLWSGFRAVSDDDYARVVIAARFAASPSLDPSGTSWLPLPFWLQGLPMMLFGDSLATARAVAFCLGMVSAVLVWRAAVLLGLTPRAALLAGLAAVLLPYGAWLSVATVPEAFCAALILLGAVSLTRPEPRLRLEGGLALGAACFCRYEAWAPTLVFGALCGLQALRSRRRVGATLTRGTDLELWLPACLALSPIALWLLHGVVRHGDPLFFVARVSAYRAALGRPPTDWLSALLGVPWAIVRFEPELFAVTSVALAWSVRRGRHPFAAGALGPVLALAALVAFLIAADITGGSATHHPERSLLPVFWFLVLLSAGLLSQLAEAGSGGWRVPLLALPLALLGNLLLRPALRETFAERHEEEQVGSLLRSVGATGVALDSDDYGYFAVQAALGYGKSWPLSDLDPRRQQLPRPTTSEALARRLQAGPARWLVLPRSRAELARPLGTTRAVTPRLAVVQLHVAP